MTSVSAEWLSALLRRDLNTLTTLTSERAQLRTLTGSRIRGRRGLIAHFIDQLPAECDVRVHAISEAHGIAVAEFDLLIPLPGGRVVERVVIAVHADQHRIVQVTIDQDAAA